jgi:hypothetical protein
MTVQVSCSNFSPVSNVLLSSLMRAWEVCDKLLDHVQQEVYFKCIEKPCVFDSKVFKSSKDAVDETRNYSNYSVKDIPDIWWQSIVVNDKKVNETIFKSIPEFTLCLTEFACEQVVPKSVSSDFIYLQIVWCQHTFSKTWPSVICSELLWNYTPDFV